MSRSEPQATSLWPLPCSVWLCLALQPQFIAPLPPVTTFSPQWPPFRFSIFFFFSSSILWVLCVFCFLYAYSCFGSFSFFRPQLSFHFLRVVFPDPYLKFLPHSLTSVSFPFTSDSQSVVRGPLKVPRAIGGGGVHKIKISFITE